MTPTRLLTGAIPLLLSFLLLAAAPARADAATVRVVEQQVTTSSVRISWRKPSVRHTRYRVILGRRTVALTRRRAWTFRRLRCETTYRAKVVALRGRRRVAVGSLRIETDFCDADADHPGGSGPDGGGGDGGVGDGGDQLPTVPLPANTVLPQITGAAYAGGALLTTTGSWTGATSYGVAWQLCDEELTGCSSIAGATDLAYTVRSSDVGSRLRVRVGAVNAAGVVVAISAATEVVSATPPALAAQAHFLLEL